jgi:PAS domain S-box-containing protein
MSQSAFTSDNSWFKQLFASSPDPTWIIEDNKFVECNEAAIRTLGYTSREEFLNVHPSKLSPAWQPDGEESYAKAERILAHVKDKGMQRFEWMHTKADGSNFVAEVTLSIIELADRQVIYCVWRDITESKQLADALRLRDQYQRALLDNFPFLVWLKDEDSRFLAVNQPFAESSGQSSIEQIVGKSDFDLWPMDLAEHYLADDKAVLTSGRSKIVEEPVEVDGRRVWYETYKSPVVVDGRVMGTVGFARDITSRKLNMAELRSSEERLRLAKTAANLGIFDHDMCSGKVTWDERLRDIWGVGPDEPITYATFMTGVHPDDRAATQATIDEALDPRSTGEYYVEYRVISRIDGKVRHVAVNGQVFFEDGHAIRLVGSIKDITPQIRMAKEMQERRSEMELLVKQQVAAQTAAAIAHELNQPLVSISVYSDAALRMLRGGIKNPERLERALEGAREQSQRAGRTLHELLDFLYQGEAAVRPVDLNEVVREALDLAKESGYGGFRSVLELERDLPPVLANRLQLQKVVVNLLHNSVEAMRSSGVPKDAITITVQAMAGGHMAQVTVRDSGPGFDAEMAERIFEPFFTTKSVGIGLGLAISRALIEVYGGRLWADPKAGTGATIHFTVPFAS